MKFEDIYYDEVTDASFQEMLELCRWLNQTRGYHPMIIGGWAVYLHHPTLGSRDIDILFPERTLKHDVVNMYLFTHNYRSEGVFAKSYFKEIKTAKRNERIIIDACSVEDINRLKGTDVVIPWKLAFDHQKAIKIEDVQLYIPKVEVMLIFKSKAAVDREGDLKKSFDPFYLQQKIIKDYHDIMTLITFCDIDFVLLKQLLTELDFNDYFVSVFKKIEMTEELIEKFENWIDRQEEFIEKLTSSL